ncbi:hypothetical protein AgCh_004049 [Apium graveolens]
MESMYTNQVWTLVEAPEGVKPIRCKWVYKRKIGADGQVETYKARLVAKGFRQRQGIDFDETFLPVALLKSIRILLAIAAYYDYEIWQIDVKTAFLNGKLEEEVWNIRFDDTIKEFGFIKNIDEPCVYKKDEPIDWESLPNPDFNLPILSKPKRTKSRAVKKVKLSPLKSKSLVQAKSKVNKGDYMYLCDIKEFSDLNLYLDELEEVRAIDS